MMKYEMIPADSVIFAIIDAARECGADMLAADRTASDVMTKSGRADFVTAYDKQNEQKLKRLLPAILPGAKFMGEEGDTADDVGTGCTFIVDPIDGTTNFIRDYHWSCVSVGLLKDNEPFIGVVYNPYTDEVFAAQKGCGTYLNGTRVRTSSNELCDSIVVFGSSPYYQELHKKTFDLAFALFEQSLDVRRSGSAALDLCAIASGRADMFFEMILSPWDYAAGAVLISEAGGFISRHDGSPITFDKPCPIFASNGIIPVSVLHHPDE